jgi:hypothetical protein
MDNAKLKNSYVGSFVLADDPMVAVIENVLSVQERLYVIEKATSLIKRAMVSLDEAPAEIQGRTGKNCWLRYRDDSSIMAIGKKIADIVGIPINYAEAMQVIHYGPGEEYRPHYDSYDLSTARGQRCCKFGGQRLLTALVYLNDVPNGGGTNFPKLSLQVEAKAGKMVVFHNVARDETRPHPMSLHGGMPVVEGDKWAFNMWFHARPMTEVQTFELPNQRKANVNVGEAASSPEADSIKSPV